MLTCFQPPPFTVGGQGVPEAHFHLPSLISLPATDPRLRAHSHWAHRAWKNNGTASRFYGSRLFADTSPTAPVTVEGREAPLTELWPWARPTVALWVRKSQRNTTVWFTGGGLRQESQAPRIPINTRHIGATNAAIIPPDKPTAGAPPIRTKPSLKNNISSTSHYSTRTLYLEPSEA